MASKTRSGTPISWPLPDNRWESQPGWRTRRREGSWGKKRPSRNREGFKVIEVFKGWGRVGSAIYKGPEFCISHSMGDCETELGGQVLVLVAHADDESVCYG